MSKQEIQRQVDLATSKVERLSADLKVLKDGGGLPLPKMSDKMPAGAIGELPYEEYTVIHVINARKMIMRGWEVSYHDASHAGERRREFYFMVRNVDTTNAIDDRAFALKGAFEVVGPESYGGTKYLVIEPIDVNAVIEYREMKKQKSNNDVSNVPALRAL